MSLDTDFAAKLTSLSGGAPVQQNYASTDKVEPRVYFQHSADNNDLLLSGSTGLQESTYTVEVAGLDPDATAAIADLMTAPYAAGGLQGYRGQMGGTTVLGCFVEDASDDYQPRGLDLDDGYHIFAFQARLLT